VQFITTNKDFGFNEDLRNKEVTNVYRMIVVSAAGGETQQATLTFEKSFQIHVPPANGSASFEIHMNFNS